MMQLNRIVRIIEQNLRHGKTERNHIGFKF
jgi:hypothetical protein